VGVAVYLVNFTFIFSYDALYLAAFMLGIVAADIQIRRIALGAWPLVVCGVAVLYAVVTPIMWYSPYDLLPIWWIASFAFIVAAGEFGWLRRLLATPALIWTGIASYSIYLVHDPIVTFACARGVSAAFAALLGVAAGFAFWYVAERPFVYTTIRAASIAALERLFHRCTQALGVRQSLVLHVSRLRSLDRPQIAAPAET